MNSPTKRSKHKHASLEGIFEGLHIESNPISPLTHMPSTRINLVRSLRQHMHSTLSLGGGTVSIRRDGVPTQFTIAMDEVYDYKIGRHEFDPETVFPEIIALGDQLSAVLSERLTSDQKTALDDSILACLVSLVYGSNMIERAGAGPDITLKLCMEIFQGHEVPEEIGETDEEFAALKKELIESNRPADTTAVLRTRREIIQHAKAASYIINQLCLHDHDLDEDVILKTHRILTYKVDAEGTPWTEYSGVYRTDNVRAGFHSFPSPRSVPGRMKAMIRELKSDLEKATQKGTFDPIAIASKYTHIFVNIHPFIDGNGRMCRLILNAMLLKLGNFLVTIGANGEDRSLYLDVAAGGSMLEDTYGDLDEDEKPVMYKELASFVMSHMKKIMGKLVGAIS
ncbi:hypothetical protein N7492_009147 [Penicillium capsulatum]|uniref:Fido domain-containing protein n=1 Tax=Penicillium capsulatum TaxID=69766 RepID=A0A9W9LHH3_9EURO|nr:hypothetical protein N7492_009147 [Penicillium capsulatum]KAJ6106546.1 hypothetical protein N7512_010063 [Penicillium capsulatum]